MESTDVYGLWSVTGNPPWPERARPETVAPGAPAGGWIQVPCRMVQTVLKQ